MRSHYSLPQTSLGNNTQQSPWWQRRGPFIAQQTNLSTRDYSLHFAAAPWGLSTPEVLQHHRALQRRLTKHKVADCSVWPTDITDFLDEVRLLWMCVRVSLYPFLVRTHNKLELYEKLNLITWSCCGIWTTSITEVSGRTFCFPSSKRERKSLQRLLQLHT